MTLERAEYLFNIIENMVDKILRAVHAVFRPNKGHRYW